MDKGRFALYDTASGNCMVYDLATAAQVFRTEQQADHITVCDIKPYRKTAVAICSGAELEVFGY